jgi:hypothetical protein
MLAQLLEEVPAFYATHGWLQIQRSGFESLRYQIFWVVVGLERGALSLVNTIEELLEKKVAVPV